MRQAGLILAVAIGACQSQGTGSRFLFVWAGDADKRESDFLAVVDADPRSANYATVVATLPVGVTGTQPHHTEYEMAADGVLWANGFDAGRTFRFNLRDPTQPRLLDSVGNPGPFSHPHSYARLSNGNILATFQRGIGSGRPETGIHARRCREIEADAVVQPAAEA